MNERPAFSVVVPFFDSERTLAACIDSLLAQQGVDGGVEILLVDNGSRDSSPAIAARYPQTTVLHEETPGAYAARNAALRRALAPVIAFTDADCVADPDWLAAIGEAMSDPTAAVVLGHCRYPAEASLPLHLLGSYENAKAGYVLERCPPAHRFAYCNNMAVRAALFGELGPFREWRRAADTEWVHRLAARRPDLHAAFAPGARVTHLEFVRARQRARRLSLYSETNAKIETFRELGLRQRLGLAAAWLRGRVRVSVEGACSSRPSPPPHGQ